MIRVCKVSSSTRRFPSELIAQSRKTQRQVSKGQERLGLEGCKIDGGKDGVLAITPLTTSRLPTDREAQWPL